MDDILAAGPLTEYDIIRVLPFGGKVLRAEVTGALLTEILNAGQANAGSGGYLHLRGATSRERRLDGRQCARSTRPGGTASRCRSSC